MEGRVGVEGRNWKEEKMKGEEEKGKGEREGRGRNTRALNICDGWTL
jgi:hypothetical protein